jgi:hypothetical protein
VEEWSNGQTKENRVARLTSLIWSFGREAAAAMISPPGWKAKHEMGFVRCSSDLIGSGRRSIRVSSPRFSPLRRGGVARDEEE